MLKKLIKKQVLITQLKVRATLNDGKKITLIIQDKTQLKKNCFIVEQKAEDILVSVAGFRPFYTHSFRTISGNFVGAKNISSYDSITKDLVKKEFIVFQNRLTGKLSW